MIVGGGELSGNRSARECGRSGEGGASGARLVDVGYGVGVSVVRKNMWSGI